MPLPRWLARTNRAFTNRVLGSIPRRISPFLLVHHTGRHSGRTYTTPLAGFDTPSGIIITPTYGPRADWVQNVLAAETLLVDRKGIVRAYGGARLIPRFEAWPHLPRLVRLAMRVLRIDWYVYAERSIVAES